MPDYDLQRISYPSAVSASSWARSGYRTQACPAGQSPSEMAARALCIVLTPCTSRTPPRLAELVKTLCDEAAIPSAGKRCSASRVKCISAQSIRKINLSKRNQKEAIMPYLLRNCGYPTQSGLVHRYHLYRRASWTVFNRNHHFKQPENRRALSLDTLDYGIRDDPCPCCRV